MRLLLDARAPVANMRAARRRRVARRVGAVVGVVLFLGSLGARHCWRTYETTPDKLTLGEQHIRQLCEANECSQEELESLLRNFRARYQAEKGETK